MIKKRDKYIENYLQEIYKKFKIYCKNDDIKTNVINGIKDNLPYRENNKYNTFITIVARIRKCYGKDIKIGERNVKLIDIHLGHEKNMSVLYEPHKSKRIITGYEILEFEITDNTTLDDFDSSRY